MKVTDASEEFNTLILQLGTARGFGQLQIGFLSTGCFNQMIRIPQKDDVQISGQVGPANTTKCCNPTPFRKLNFMNSEPIQILLLKLKDGTRLLRLTGADSGLALEKQIDPKRPLLPQKQQLLTLFDVTLKLASTLST